jgi:hypothetical protein
MGRIMGDALSMELHSGTHRSGTHRHGISISLPCLHASHVLPKRSEEEYRRCPLCTSILMDSVSTVSLLDGDVHRENYCSYNVTHTVHGNIPHQHPPSFHPTTVDTPTDPGKDILE